MTDAAVEGESSSLVMIVRGGRVINGGSAVEDATPGGVFRVCLLGLLPGEICCFVNTFRDLGDWEAVRPVKELIDPEPPKLNLLERLLLLLCPADDLLDVVDWDHRFRFPTPSLIPVILLGLLWPALVPWMESIDRAPSASLAPPLFASFGLCDRSARLDGREPVSEAARCTVTTEEEETEFDRETRWCFEAWLDAVAFNIPHS